MIDYSKLKKDELIVELEQMQHLVSTVEAKDKEINTLKDKHAEELLNITRLHSAKLTELKLKREEETNKLTEQYNQSLLKNENQIDSKVYEIRTQLEKDNELLQKEATTLKYALDRRTRELNKLLYTYGDLLKALESITNTHLSLNNYLIEDIGK